VCDVTEHKKAEGEIQRLNKELEQRVAERTARLAESERHLKDLADRLAATQEEDRRRLAYELQDGLTQVLIAAYHRLEHVALEHPTGSTVTVSQIDRALAFVRQTVGKVHLVIEDLRPAALDDLGLAETVKMRVADLEAEGLEVSLKDTLGDERPSREVGTALYRVFQQVLTNVRKHACTNKAYVNRAYVNLSCRGANVRIELRDEGCGFTASSAAAVDGEGESVGLAGMRERMALLGSAFGGSLATSAPGPPSRRRSHWRVLRRGRGPSVWGEGWTAARMLIVEDCALSRGGMRISLSGEPDLQVVGEAGDGREALELCHDLCPDLVLIDVRMPRMGSRRPARSRGSYRPSAY
jgi:CheY-like chemotaxis protein